MLKVTPLEANKVFIGNIMVLDSIFGTLKIPNFVMHLIFGYL